MRSDQRIIRQMPLTEIWDATGVVSTVNLGGRGREAIKQLLRLGQVWFVIANPGDAPRWIALADCYAAWKTDICDHLVEPEEQWICYDTYPGEYCYLAHEWASYAGIPIIVLSIYH